MLPRHCPLPSAKTPETPQSGAPVRPMRHLTQENINKMFNVQGKQEASQPKPGAPKHAGPSAFNKLARLRQNSSRMATLSDKLRALVLDPQQKEAAARGVWFC